MTLGRSERRAMRSLAVGALIIGVSGSDGQLGNDSTTNSAVPVAVSGVARGVTASAAGSQHTWALVNGGVRCWGHGTQGQLGDGNAINSLVPVQVTGLTSGVSAIAAGGDYSRDDCHTCAIVNGGAKCWGYGGNGRLGNGYMYDYHVPASVSGLSTGVTAIAT